MTLLAQSSAFVTLLLLLLVMIMKIEGNILVHDYAINISEMNEVVAANDAAVDQEPPVTCRNRPFACSFGEFPPRSLCCGNSCVDVTSDTANCGLCGIRCSFNYKCCNRLCINTNINPLNCGRCGRVCPIGRLCLFGLCGGVQDPYPMPPPLTEPPTSMPDQNAAQSLNHQYPNDAPAIME
ncbi:hypothetical protein TanjilG_19077 [Lupinus angustifolius]|uniref:Uncharacterized protein n=1 Tax=Lupinus angustifolius TaxID=3871 RepID=A0A4P1RS53_LUPAN|nr:PREDICTED: stigma-specific STIG1-like protein 4 [Lupinus angustifolius]OIW16361.1 hypothetical protein TanjilG_19077 [Lupinus angustifolius]